MLKKKLAFLLQIITLCTLIWTESFGQNITTTIGNYNPTNCAVGDTIILPVTVSMASGISTAAISLAIDFDTTKLRPLCTGSGSSISCVTNLNSNIASGFLSNVTNFSNQTPNPPYTSTTRKQFRAAWFNLVPVSFNGLMFNLRFVVVGTGNSVVKWDLATPGNCEYADEFADVIPNVSFIDGNITCQPSGPPPCVPPSASVTAAGSITFCQGGSVVLNANTGTGLTYQWNNNGTAISGATNASYTANAAGSYTVTVLNAPTCSTVSGAVQVAVSSNNTIALSSAAGTSAQTLTVNTPLTSITYATTGATGATVTGLPAGVNGLWANNTVTISGTPTATGTFNYTVTMTGGCTGGSNSATGSITVSEPACVPPSASVTAAGSTTFCQGGSVVLNANTGTGLTYQWNNNGTAISGATNASYTANAAGSYTVTVLNAPTCSTVSGAVQVAVSSNNTIALSSAAGTSAQTLTVNTPLTSITYATTGATGATVTGLPAGVNGLWANNTVTISGTPTATGTFNYTVTMTGGCTGGVNSASGSITINGGSSGNFNIETTIGNYNPTNCAVGDTIILPVTVSMASGISTAAISLAIDFDTTKLRPLCTGSGSSISCVTNLNSNIASGFLSNVTNFSNQTPNPPYTSTTRKQFRAAWFNLVPVSFNGLMFNLRFVVVGTGNSVVKWDLATPGNCEYADEFADVIPNVSFIDGNITCQPSGPPPCVPPSASVTAAGSITFCQGGSVVLNANTGTGLTYQWNNNGTAISGATNASYTANAAGSYTVTVLNAPTCSTVSGAVQVAVSSNNTIALSSAAGTSAQTLTVNTPLTSITYATTGATGATVTGLPAGVNGLWANNTVTISGTPTATGTFNYTVTMTGGCTGGSNSATGSITVSEPACVPPSASVTAAGSTTFCQGGSVVLNANTGTGLTYQWNNNGTAISGATNASYTANAAGSYTVTVLNAPTCSTVSGAVQVAVSSNNTIALSSAAGTSAQTLTVNTPLTSITYATTGATGATVTGLPAGVNGLWANNTVTISGTPTATGTFNYTVTMTGGCIGATNSINGSIVVNQLLPVTVTINNSTTSCPGDVISIPIKIENGSNIGAISLAINYNPNHLTFQNYSALNPGLSNNFLINNINNQVRIAWFDLNAATFPNNATLFNLVFVANQTSTLTWNTQVLGDCEIGDSAGNVLNSVFVNGQAIVNGIRSSITYTGNTNLCSGDSILLSGPSGQGATYQWLLNNNIIVGATNQTYLAGGAGTYSLSVASGNNCSSLSDPLTINLRNRPNASIVATGYPNLSTVSVCSGSTIVLNATTGSTLIYQWSLNGNPISGATQSALTIPSLSNQNTGTYTVLITDVQEGSSCSRVSEPFVLNSKNPGFSTLNITLPSGSQYTVCSQTFSTSGTYTVVCPGASANGCDSIVTLNLSINPPLTTTISTLSGCVGDTVSVPVSVTNLVNVGAISLALNYNATSLSFIGFESLNSAFNPNDVLINSGVFGGQSQVRLSWFSANPVNLGSGTANLVTYRFVVNASSSLSWDLATVGNCEYADPSATPITNVSYNNGAINANAIPVTNLTQTIPYGTTYNFCGQTLIYSGTYSCNLTAASGCDSIVNLALTVSLPSPLITTIGQVNGCVGDTVSVPVTLQNSVGISALSLAINYDTLGLAFLGASNVHPSLASTFLINASTFSGQNQVRATWFDINPSVLNGLLFNMRFVVTASSALTFDLATVGNCEYNDVNADIIPNTQFVGGGVTALQSSSSIITQTLPSGGSLTVCGQTFNTSGVYTIVCTASNGCDSVITLNLTVPISVNIGSNTTCAGDTVVIPVTAFSVNGVGAISLSMDYNTSQLTFLDATEISPNLESSLIVNAGVFNGQTQVRAGWFDLNPVNLNGLLFNMRFIGHATGALSFDLATPGNCELADANADPIPGVTFNSGTVQVLPNAATTVNQTVPFQGSFTVCGQTFSNSGTYTISCIASNGCDSVVTLNLSVDGPSLLTSIGAANSCVGDTVSVPVQVSHLNGVGAISLALNYNSNALSFIGYENVQSAINSSNLLINSGVFNGQSQVRLSWFSANPISLGAGPVNLVNYRFVVNASSPLSWDLATVGNCEYADPSATPITNVSYNNGAINANAIPVTNLTQTIPYGTTYNFCGQTLIYSGTYSCNLTAASGCDSIVNLALTVSLPSPLITTIGQVNGCVGDTVSVPVTLQNSVGISALSLAINYDTLGLAFLGASNVHPSLASTFLINASTFSGQNQVRATWFDINPSVLNGLLFNMRFVVTASSALTFDLATVGNCEYNDVNADIIPNTQFVGGGVTAVQPVYTSATRNLSYGGTYTACGQTFNTPGTYTLSCTAASGCDSVVTLTLVSVNSSLSIGSATVACPGDVITVPVTVNDVTNLAAISLALNYNPQALTFINYSGLNPAIANNFLINNINGQVRIAWFDLNPATFSSSTTLFNLVFSVQGASALTWNTSVPGDCELGNLDGDIIPTTFNSGSIGLNGVTSVITANRPTNLCTGDQVILSGGLSTGATYQWNLNGAPINGATNNSYTTSTAGSYTLTISSGLNCSSVSSPVVVSVRTRPNATVTASGLTNGLISLCQGNSVTLNANTGSGLTYQWSINGNPIIGATNASYQTTTQGTYQVTVTNTNEGNGCSNTSDSVMVSVKPNAASSITASICQGQTYTFGTLSLTAAGTYNRTVTAANGCDSVISLTLQVNPIYSSNISASICQGQSYTLGNQTYNQSGTFTQTFVSTSGCDSIINLSLTVKPNAASSITASICQGQTYTFGTLSLTAAGTYNRTVTAANGCDSVISLTLTVRPNRSASISATICQGQTYVFGTQILTNSGTYTRTTTAVNGCDSVITLSLQVNQPSVSIAASNGTTTCQGGSVTLSITNPISSAAYQWRRNGVNISGATNTTLVTSLSGSFTALVNSNGCLQNSNSLEVTVLPAIDTSISLTLCAGSSYSFGSTVITAPGSYTNTFATSGGCDSIVTITVNYNSPAISSNSTQICAGESYTFFGTPLNQTGTYTYTDTAASCDTIYILALTVNSRPAKPILTANILNACDGGTIILSATPSSSFLTYFWYRDGILVTPNGLNGSSGGATLQVTTSGLYQVESQNNLGCRSERSEGQTLSFTQPATIAQHPAAQSVAYNGNASFSVAMSGGSGYQYQWQIRMPGGVSWINMTSPIGSSSASGFTSPTLNLTGISSGINGADFRVRVTKNSGCFENLLSDPARLNVGNSDPVSVQIGSSSFCSGTNTLVSVPMVVNNFSNIALIDMRVSLGSSLTFNGLSSVNPALSSVSAIVLPSGILSLSWYSSGSLSLPNGTSLFNLDLLATSTDTARIASGTTFSDRFGGNIPYLGGSDGIITENAPTVPTVNATSNFVCAGSGQSVTLSGTPTGGIFSGTGISGNTFVTTGLPEGTYVITYTYVNPFGCSATTQIGLEIRPNPTATVSPATATLCSGQSVTLSANTGTGLSYQWRLNGNPISGATQSNFNASSNGSYSVAVTSGGCTTVSSNSTVILDIPPTLIISGNTTLCRGGVTTLAVRGATTYLWTPNIGISSVTDSNPTLNPNTTTDYVVYGYRPGSNCVSTATVRIVVNDPPLVDAGSDLNSCGGVATLTPTFLSNHTYNWSGPNLTSTGVNPQVNPLTTSTYVLTVTNNATGCQTIDSVRVFVPKANAGPNAFACANSPTALQGRLLEFADPNESVDFTWRNLGSGTIISSQLGVASGLSTLSVSPNVTTNYELSITRDAGNCTLYDTVQVTVLTTPVVAISGNSSIALAPQATVPISATLTGASSGRTVTWTFVGSTSAGTGTLSSTSVLNPTYTAPQVASIDSLRLVVTVTNPNGCNSVDTLTVVIDPALQGKTLRGVLRYDNATGSPVPNAVVRLTNNLNQGTSTEVNSQGGFFFSNLPNGTYSLQIVLDSLNSRKSNVGITSADVQLINGYRLNRATSPLNGNTPSAKLRLRAADVSTVLGSSNTAGADTISIADAQAASQKAANGNPTNAFNLATPPRIWAIPTTATSITISGQDTVVDLYTVSYGDVNGSFTPVIRQSNSIKPETTGVQLAKELETLSYPIQAMESMELASWQMTLKLQKGYEVRFAEMPGDPSPVTVNQKGNTLTMVWFAESGQPVQLSEGDPVVMLHIVKNNLEDWTTPVTEPLLTETEFNDQFAQGLVNPRIAIPKVVHHSALEASVYPNPATNSEFINIQIATELSGDCIIQIVDALGRIVRELNVSTETISGQKGKINLSTESFNTGSYLCRVQLNTKDGQFFKVNQQFIIKN